jgi:hypothetical protein
MASRTGAADVLHAAPVALDASLRAAGLSGDATAATGVLVAAASGGKGDLPQAVSAMTTPAIIKVRFTGSPIKHSQHWRWRFAGFRPA